MSDDYRRLLHALFALPLTRPASPTGPLAWFAEDKTRQKRERVGTHTYQVIEPDDSSIKVPIPSLGQQADYTCACGALRPVFKYFGVGPNPDEEAAYRRGMNADPEDGTPPDELVRFAEDWGLQQISYQGMTIADVLAFLDQGKPVVCAIQAWGKPRQYRKRRSGHYVTAIGYDDSEHLIVHDPAIKQNRGYRSFPEFDKLWYDQEADGTIYDHWGMAVWLPDRDELGGSADPVAVSRLKKAKEIE